MRIPDFVAIAKRYAPDIAIENQHHLDLIQVGRWISFDMRAIDGIDFINGIGQKIKPAYDALQAAKECYDNDIKATLVIASPSRNVLYKALVGTLRDDVLNAQLAEVDCYELLCYIHDKGPWPADHWDAVCPELAEWAKRLRKEADGQRDRIDRGALMKRVPSTGPKDLIEAVAAAKAEYQSKKQPTFVQGEEKMKNEITINYHSRLVTANGELTGTITLSINGELAIVDVECPKDDVKVRYHWVTMPKKGYDTTVHSLVRWFGDVAAAAVMVTVYPDGGTPKTVTVTLEA